MAVDAENLTKKLDPVTGICQIAVGTHLDIPLGQEFAAKQAALQGFDQFQAWLQANLPAGSMKTWHTVTAPQYYKMGIWNATKV